MHVLRQLNGQYGVEPASATLERGTMKSGHRVVSGHGFVDRQIVDVDRAGSPAQEMELESGTRPDDRRTTRGKLSWSRALKIWNRCPLTRTESRSAAS